MNLFSVKLIPKRADNNFNDNYLFVMDTKFFDKLMVCDSLLVKQTNLILNYVLSCFFFYYISVLFKFISLFCFNCFFFLYFFKSFVTQRFKSMVYSLHCPFSGIFQNSIHLILPINDQSIFLGTYTKQ